MCLTNVPFAVRRCAMFPRVWRPDKWTKGPVGAVMSDSAVTSSSAVPPIVLACHLFATAACVVAGPTQNAVRPSPGGANLTPLIEEKMTVASFGKLKSASQGSMAIKGARTNRKESRRCAGKSAQKACDLANGRVKTREMCDALFVTVLGVTSLTGFSQRNVT